MNILGIIAEYNPFHNGHKYHLETAKKIADCAYAVCIMSGHFTQRGDTALLDKWKRAQMAVASGADLVIELPAVFAVRSAEKFAEHAILLLHRLGIITHLGFGAETNQPQLLQRAALAFDQPKVRQNIKQRLTDGKPYPQAVSEAVRQFLGTDDAFLNEPNNILAVEYMKALYKHRLPIIPVPITRRAAKHNSKTWTGSIASATAIRHAVYAAETPPANLLMALPLTTYKLLLSAYRNNELSDLERLSPILLASLRRKSAEELLKVPGISEGLEYKIASCAQKATSIRELAFLLKSKRYPLTRLQRILIHCLLQTDRQALIKLDALGPLYARILAFNTPGRMLLRNIKKNASIPILTKTAPVFKTPLHSPELRNMLSADLYATDLFRLSLGNQQLHTGAADFLTPPIYVP